MPQSGQPGCQGGTCHQAITTGDLLNFQGSAQFVVNLIELPNQGAGFRSIRQTGQLGQFSGRQRHFCQQQHCLQPHPAVDWILVVQIDRCQLCPGRGTQPGNRIGSTDSPGGGFFPAGWQPNANNTDAETTTVQNLNVNQLCYLVADSGEVPA